MAGLERQCAKCSKKIPTTGVKVGPATAAAARFRKGQYAGRWLCSACGVTEKSRGQLVETLYVADPKGKELLPAAKPAGDGKPQQPAELPKADAQA